MRIREADVDFDLYEQERRYRAATGDKPYFMGFSRRLAEWCEKNPRRQLKSTGATKSNAEN